MELWIRSQDKEILLKPICFEIDEESKNTFLILTKVAQNYNDICVGLYKTKERALEVLDEIQNILMPKCLINAKSMKFSKPYEENGMVLMDCSADARIETLSTYVYEMPKD